jgi:hypothetical protein
MKVTSLTGQLDWIGMSQNQVLSDCVQRQAFHQGNTITVHTTQKASDGGNTDPGMWPAAVDGSSGRYRQLGAYGGVRRTAREEVSLQQHKWTYTHTHTNTNT